MPPNPILFRNSHNVPLKCFIQFDSAPEIVVEIRNLLESHGADVSTYLQHALVILVDPPTPGGQLLIREFGNDSNRAILDFGWVRKCVQLGRCIGPSENWGGHRLPVTNVNDFFAYSGPSAAHSVTPSINYTKSVGPYQHAPPHQTHHYQASANMAPLPSPATSQALPPSPILTHRDRSEGKSDVPAHVPGAAVKNGRQDSTTASDDGSEPEPPDPSAKVLHHNGMGAKFTDVDNDYIRKYFGWSQKHYPQRTQRQVVEKISEKMPYHSAVSVIQYMRRNPHLFGDVMKSERTQKAEDAVPRVPHRSREKHIKIAYDPGNAGGEEPPQPPTNLVPFAKGFRFTSADDEYIIAFFNWYNKHRPQGSRTDALRELATHATYRSLPSWTTHFHKYSSEFRKKIPWLHDLISDDDEEEGTSPESEDGKEVPVVATATDVEIDEADTRRWNPPRKTSISKSVSLPSAAPEENDGEYLDRSTRSGPLSPRAVRHTVVKMEAPAKRRGEGQRRRSIAFSAEEKREFIEFLSDHPWVWTTVTIPKEWMQGATPASTVWAKYQSLHPHRSDASWREYHKRNAGEFDAEAKALRLARAGGRAPPPPPRPEIFDDSDQDPVDDDDEEDYDGDLWVAQEEGVSSFSYAPVVPAADDSEEDQLQTDDEVDSLVTSKQGTPLTASSAPGQKGSRRGRPYISFTQEQRDRFMEFLTDNAQVWTGAPVEPGWVTEEQIKLGKDSTWRELAKEPGMSNHSYKSWREYHRARANDVDKIARQRRLDKEAARANASSTSILAPSIVSPPIPTITSSSMSIPTIIEPVATAEPVIKRNYESDSDMDMSSRAPTPKRTKIEEQA